MKKHSYFYSKDIIKKCKWYDDDYCKKKIYEHKWTYGVDRGYELCKAENFNERCRVLDLIIKKREQELSRTGQKKTIINWRTGKVRVVSYSEK